MKLKFANIVMTGITQKKKKNKEAIFPMWSLFKNEKENFSEGQC